MLTIDALELSQKRIDLLVQAGRVPSAYFLCDSLLDNYSWPNDQVKLDFYARFYEVLTHAYGKSPELKAYLIDRDYPRYEEVIRLAWSNPNHENIQLAIEYIQLIRSLYLEKQSQAKVNLALERTEEALFSTFTQYQQLIETEGQSDISNALEQKLDSLKEEITRLGDIRLAANTIGELPDIQLDTLKKYIPKREAWITYFIGQSNPHGYAIVLTRDTQLIVQLGKVAIMEQTILQYQGNVKAMLRRERLAQNQVALYQLVFQALAPHLQQIDQLVIIPDRWIGLIGFEALLTHIPTDWDRSPDFPSLPYLIDSENDSDQ